MSKKRKNEFNILNQLPTVEATTKKGIIIVLIFSIAVLCLLSIFDLAGGFGRIVYYVLKFVFGWGFWIFPLALFLSVYLFLDSRRNIFKKFNPLGLFLVILGYSGFFHLLQKFDNFKQTISSGEGGGFIGFAVSFLFYQYMGRWGGLVIMLTLFVVGIMITFDIAIENFLDIVSLRDFRERLSYFINVKIRKKGIESGESIYEEDDNKEKIGFYGREIEEKKEDSGLTKIMGIEENGEDEDGDEIGRKASRKKYSTINLPIDLLNNVAESPKERDIDFCKENIKKTLSNFGIEVEMGEYAIGPTVTQYTFRPADGVKLSRIIGLSNDLSLSLAAHPIRIEAPIPGKALVGIEVPNKKIAVVPLRRVLESKEYAEIKGNLNIALGQDVAGKAWVTDLSKLPHLLVAGATNSGKTVCLNAIIISLLYRNQPDQLKLILVDPKRVEMVNYNGIPHLLTPVIVDIKKTINALKWTIGEMERRFHVLSNASKRNILSYNEVPGVEKLPYIVFIIDELADLMSVASAEVEAAIIRLAQMSRAVGIHLILATQRPSVDIITGLIKANIPGRVAFSVASLIDSRTILDTSGAEKLLGRGDMLFTSAEISKPKRLQGAYASDQDIEKVVEYLKKAGEPDYIKAVTERISSPGQVNLGSNDFSSNEDDELLEEAKETIIKAEKASASYLQRKLKIGYARAARILDLLEEQGVVGPADGAKARDVLIRGNSTEEMDEYFEKPEEEIDEDILAEKENDEIKE